MHIINLPIDILFIYIYIHIHVWSISTSLCKEWELPSGFLGGVTPTFKESNWRLFKWPLRFAICLSVCHLLAIFCLDLLSLDRILFQPSRKWELGGASFQKHFFPALFEQIEQCGCSVYIGDYTTQSLWCQLDALHLSNRNSNVYKVGPVADGSKRDEMGWAPINGYE